MCASCASSCRERFPGFTFSFLPADIISQILNFGAPAPIDVQVRGSDLDADFELRQPAARPHPPDPRRRRCAHPAVAQRAGLQRRYRPHARPVCRPDRARRHQLPGRQPRRHRPGRADLLAQSRERRHLQRSCCRRRSTGSIRCRRCPTCRSRRRRQCRDSQVLGGIADISRDDGERGGLAIRPPAHGPGLCHRCRAATSARSPRDVRRIDRRTAQRRRRRDPRVKLQGQVETMKAPSPACCSACLAPSC